MTIDRLHEANSALLAGDPDALSDAELHEIVVGLERECARFAAARARFVSRWEARQIWADDGSRSAGARLAREAGLAKSSGDAEVKRARRLRSMPATAAALAERSISTDHVALLAQANSGCRTTRFAEHEADLVGFCQRMRYREVRNAIAYWCQRADAEGCEDDAARLKEGRGASVAETIDGTVVLNATFDAVGGTAVKSEIERIERELYRQEKAAGATTRTAAQRRADAIVEMANRSRAARPGGLRPRPLITILAGCDTFARTCELAEGAVLTPGQLVPLLADADIERIVFDGPNRVISVSHRRRFTGALRRAIEVRDRHCQHPSGCDEPVTHCDVDHIVPHSAGGLTSQENGRIECPPHNRIAERQRPPPPAA